MDKPQIELDLIELGIALENLEQKFSEICKLYKEFITQDNLTN